MSSRLSRVYTLTLTVKSSKGVLQSSIAEGMKEMMDKMDVETIRGRLKMKEVEG